MGAKNSTQSNITYLKLRSKTSESDPTPFFGRNEKKGDAWVLTETFNTVDGRLVSIESDSYEYEGEKKWKCKMKFTDPDGSQTMVESNFNNLLYSLINSLLSAESYDDVLIQVWLGKGKEGGKQYPNCGLVINGEKVGWKIAWEDQPKPTSEMFKGKKITDDTNVITFWKEKILELNSRLAGKTISAETQEPPPEVEKDDLPF